MGYKVGTTDLYPLLFARFAKVLAAQQIPPPLCRACRPTPRRHSSCKDGRAGGARPLPSGPGLALSARGRPAAPGGRVPQRGMPHVLDHASQPRLGATSDKAGAENTGKRPEPHTNHKGAPYGARAQDPSSRADGRFSRAGKGAPVKATPFRGGLRPALTGASGALR
jgi:hypothetical protein